MALFTMNLTSLWEVIKCRTQKQKLTFICRYYLCDIIHRVTDLEYNEVSIFLFFCHNFCNYSVIISTVISTKPSWRRLYVSTPIREKHLAMSYMPLQCCSFWGRIKHVVKDTGYCTTVCHDKRDNKLLLEVEEEFRGIKFRKYIKCNYLHLINEKWSAVKRPIVKSGYSTSFSTWGHCAISQGWQRCHINLGFCTKSQDKSYWSNTTFQMSVSCSNL